MTTQFVKIPMTSAICGRTQQIDLQITFEIYQNKELRFISIEGTVGEESYDMGYLTHSHGTTLVECVIGNKENWNNDKLWYRSLDNSLKLVHTI